MGRGSQKPRKKMDARKYFEVPEQKQKQEKDWTFEDILRSKSRRR